MTTLKITPESISNTLAIDWKLAQEGNLNWAALLNIISTLQDFYRHSGGDLSASEYEDLQFLWEHALSRVYK